MEQHSWDSLICLSSELARDLFSVYDNLVFLSSHGGRVFSSKRSPCLLMTHLSKITMPGSNLKLI